MHKILTERLILRSWRHEDLELFAKMNSDPQVMEFFPALLSKEESETFAKRYINHIEENGWGLWAAELPGIASFIGFIGLSPITFDVPFAPAVEIGWRLAQPYWGKGYATEGAKAVLEFGFHQLNLNEIVAFTVKENIRSRHVMEKIGMHYAEGEDFDNPRVPIGNKRRRQILYRITK